MTEAHPQSTPVDAQAGEYAYRTAWICAAQLVTAEAALAAQNGGSARGSKEFLAGNLAR
jgi:hypothetical protein